MSGNSEGGFLHSVRCGNMKLPAGCWSPLKVLHGGGGAGDGGGVAREAGALDTPPPRAAQVAAQGLRLPAGGVEVDQWGGGGGVGAAGGLVGDGPAGRGVVRVATPESQLIGGEKLGKEWRIDV